MPLPTPDVPAIDGEQLPDWFGDAADVASAIGRGPERRSFGETPKAPEGLPKEEYPPSIDERPLERVGKSYRTSEGEQILRVSNHSYISLGTQSLTMQDVHKAREGVRRCNIYAGKRKPRSDLFNHLRRPPKPRRKGGEKGKRGEKGTQPFNRGTHLLQSCAANATITLKGLRPL